MPSAATITSFFTFAPSTTIRSSRVNDNFSVFRGHLLPVDPNTIAAAGDTYGLGSSEHPWLNSFQHINVYSAQSTTPSAPPTGFVSEYFKTDGILYQQNASGTESAIGSGGGGGGIEVEWFTQNDAPVLSIDSNSENYEFEDALTQNLYADIRVPDSYVLGEQINLKGNFYSSLTSGTALFRSVATLIRTGTDATTDTTNNHTSTNSAITLSASANVETAVDMDITDGSGEINSVAVTPGDRIKLLLVRATGVDTAAGLVKFFRKGFEVTL